MRVSHPNHHGPRGKELCAYLSVSVPAWKTHLSTRGSPGQRHLINLFYFFLTNSITYSPRPQKPACPRDTALVMASPAQIAANQANSRKSTGPRSVEGKSASRFNALKHGIDAQSAVIPGEDPQDYETLHAAYRREHRPDSPSETFHVDTMLRADWQKRRLERIEADLTRTLLAETPGASLASALLSNSPAAKLLARTQRQIAACERSWHRANTELRRARRLNDNTDDKAFDKYLDVLCPSEELASIPQEESPAPPAAPQPLKSVKNWPPIDETTGRPKFFVG